MKSAKGWSALTTVGLILLLAACGENAGSGAQPPTATLPVASIATNTDAPTQTPAAGELTTPSGPTIISKPGTATPGQGGGKEITGAWKQVVSGGFKDPSNWGTFGGALFDGYFYVGTIAGATGMIYSGGSKLPAQIRRTRDGESWEQVGADGLGNVNNWAFSLPVFKDKLYATTLNQEEGLEVWASSDGTEFKKVASGGFGNKDNGSALLHSTVFGGLFIIPTTNAKGGIEIWTSEDGATFDKAVSGGLGDPGNGAPQLSYAVEFGGKLYLGTNNRNGAELWRTADGIQWERVADGGAGVPANTTLRPHLVFKDQIYVVAGKKDYGGMDVFRSADGVTWEKVVADGFGAGQYNNTSGWLREFKGDLYLVAINFDPRDFTANPPTEARAARGFQMFKSVDGQKWDQVGELGFGNDNNFAAHVQEVNGTLYLTTTNFKDGCEVWRSRNGAEWERIFKQDSGSLYLMPGEASTLWEEPFKDHFFLFINDLKKGAEIWRYGP